MYISLLISKYLRKRRIAWVALLAVTLCTAMVIIIISVMGGWLRMFKQSFHGLSGDVIVHGQSLTGFPYYQEMIDRLEKLPEVAAAVPTIDTFAILNNNDGRSGVQARGIPIDRIGLVTPFPTSLWRQYKQKLELADAPGTPAEKKKALRDDAAASAAHPSFELPLDPDQYRLMHPGAKMDPATWPGMIVGSGVVGIHKDEDGNWVRPKSLLEWNARLTTVAIDPNRPDIDIAGDKVQNTFWIVDDSHTDIFQADGATVYVAFDVLQRDLRMTEDSYVDTQTQQRVVTPARTSEIQVAGKPGIPLDRVRAAADRVVKDVYEQHEVSTFTYPVNVQTWEQMQSRFISAVEHEKILVVFLFGIVSVVAIFLVFCIFYMIVAEKTRDIGIVKSVGATNRGVAGIFLGYGLIIGILGALLGLLAAYGVVHNINEMHNWLKQQHQWFGYKWSIVIWSPDVYMFSTIPNTMDPTEVSVIVAVAICSSVVGALIPSYRAARMHPVEALRFE